MSTLPPRTAAATVPELRFGNCVIRPSLRDVLLDGAPVKLGARAFDLLLVLVERRDEVVSKRDLLDTVWPETIVEENNLQVHISSLRKLLGPYVIATIPGRGYRFTAALATAGGPADNVGGPPPVAPLESADRGNLPRTAPILFGRDEDLRAVQALLASNRLVSIIGAAGIGKTRLAQVAAFAQRAACRDGGWFVDLAATTNPALLPAAVVQTVRAVLPGPTATCDAVADALHDKQMLIVLDNCEHLLTACAELVAAILARAPGIHLLITSQEPLHLTDEQQMRLRPLAIPDIADEGGLRESGAVALFAARAHASDPRFHLNDGNVAAVLDICRRLDGIPLAIELAAARVALLGVDGLRARLDERFRVLTGGARIALRRHQTLHAAMQWSYALLTAAEQTVFRRIGAFVGSFTMHSAQRVAADEQMDIWAVLDHLGALVDKSLVFVDDGNEPRYRLLETTRSFALEQLSASGEMEAILLRHAQSMQDLFAAALDERWLVPVQERLARYLPDIDNLRAALEWCSRADCANELLIALTGKTAWLWLSSGNKPEGRRYCEVAIGRITPATSPAHEAQLMLASATLEDADASTRMRQMLERAVELCRLTGDRAALHVALSDQARAVALAGDLPHCSRLIEEAEALVDTHWPAPQRGYSATAKSYLLWTSGRLAEARAVVESALHLAEATGDVGAQLNALTFLEQIAASTGACEDAITLGREILDRNQRSQHRFSVSIALGNLSAALTEAGRTEEALAVARECIPLKTRDGSLWIRLDAFALLAVKRNRVNDAALVLGCVDAIYRRHGYPRQPNEQRAHDQVLAALQRALPEADLQHLLSEGAALTAIEAARIALAD